MSDSAGARPWGRLTGSSEGRALVAVTRLAAPDPDPDPGGFMSFPESCRRQLDTLFRADPHAAHLGAELVDWALGEATVACVVDQRHTNFLGTGHGGVAFSLADIAMSVASNSSGRVAVAVQLGIAYARPVTVGDRLQASATVTTSTRRFAHVSVEVHAGERLAATANGITYRTDDWHLGPEAWPDEWRGHH